MASRAVRNLMRRGFGNSLVPPPKVTATSRQMAPVSTPQRGRLAATSNITYASPGQPMQIDQTSLQGAVDAYLGSVYVMRCVRVIASTIAGLEWKAGNDPLNPSKTSVGAPLAQLLGPATPQAPGGPNPTTSSQALWMWSLIQFVVTGKWAWECELNGSTKDAEVVGLWPLVSVALDPVPTMDGSHAYWSGYQYTVPTGSPIMMAPERVAYFWRPSIRDWRVPESDLMACDLPIYVARATDRYMASLLKNGMVAGHLIVSPPYEDAAAERAWEEQFASEFLGADNAGRPIFGYAERDEDDTTAQPLIQVEKLAQTAVDAQLIELAKEAKIDITIGLGVPISLIGNASQRSYANAEAEYRNFWTTRLIGVVEEVQDYVNSLLAPRLGREVGWFDLSKVAALQPPSIFAPPMIADVINLGVASPQQIANVLAIPPEDATGDADSYTVEQGEEDSAIGALGKGSGRSAQELIAAGIRLPSLRNPNSILPPLPMNSHAYAHPETHYQRALEHFCAFLKPRIEVFAPKTDGMGFRRAAELRQRTAELRQLATVDRTAKTHDAKLNRAGGPIDVSPIGLGKNWVTDNGGLPGYIRGVAHALMRDGHSETEAITIAIGKIKDWAAGRKAWGDKGTPEPETVARAQKALAEWEALKARAHRDAGPLTESSSAAALLPVGPTKKQAKAIDEEMEPHRFQGADLTECDACGLAVSAPIHMKLRQRHAGPDHVHAPTGHVKGNLTRHKAAQKARFGQDIAKVEGPLEAALSAYFEKQRTSVLARLTGKRGKQMLKRSSQGSTSTAPPPVAPVAPVIPPPLPPINPSAVFNSEYWTQELVDVLRPYLDSTGALAQGSVHTQLGAPDLSHAQIHSATAEIPNILALQANQTAPRVTETTWQQIMSTLEDGMAAGEGLPQLTKRVNVIFDGAAKARAKTIAQTETIKAYNTAAQQYASSLPPERVGSKVWLAHHDQRTRPAHRLADGQEVPVGSPFYVGGYPMMFPGDPVAPPDLVIGCRCSQAYLPPGMSKKVLGFPVGIAQNG